MANAAFRPQQVRQEILSLLRLVRDSSPRRVLEVGGRRGGTIILFMHVAHPEARLLSLDIAYTPVQVRIASRLSSAEQVVTCWPADSHSPETLRRVQDWLDGEPLDFLFIDGDHSLAGVSRDFDLYAPLVREGGLVALHDIVPDSRTRGGPSSASNVGDVPAFWTALKARGFPAQEIVENPEQDGLGIGVLPWTAAAAGLLERGQP